MDGINVCVFIEASRNPGKLFEEHKRNLREMLSGSYWNDLVLIYHSAGNEATSRHCAEQVITKVRKICAERAVGISILGCSVTRSLPSYSTACRIFPRFSSGEVVLTDFPPADVEHFFVYIMQKQHFIYVPKYAIEGRRTTLCFVSAREGADEGILLETTHNCSVVSLSHPPKSNGVSTVYIKTRLYEEIPCSVIDAVALTFSISREGNLWLVAPKAMPVIGPAVHSVQLVGLASPSDPHRRSSLDISRQIEGLSEQVREIRSLIVPPSASQIPPSASQIPPSASQTFLFSLPTDN